jgi:RNA polymerase sigma factor (sigma-70 family)
MPMDDLTDAELVARARAGDKQAFGTLAARYRPLAEHVALGMLGHADGAREAAQEALLQAYLGLEHLRQADRFRSWLYGIVLNVCRAELRGRYADPLSLEALAGGLQVTAFRLPAGGPDPQEIVEERELQRLVLAAVEALTPSDREAALLFYYGDLSLREVAALLGISVGAVKTRLHKARRQLRERLIALAPEENETRRYTRRDRMVEVKLVDVVRRPDEHGPQHILVLLDEAGRRVLPIWVGPSEAMCIAMPLRGVTNMRPMTLAFTAKLLAVSGATVEEVCVSALKDSVFYATVKLRQGGTLHEIDARPSDALGLAVYTGSPLYVAEDVLATAGRPLPDGVDVTGLGQGMARMVEEVEREMRAYRQRLAEPIQEDEEREWQMLSELIFRG